ncbi:MAG TPA: tetratricopeptide repeat protein [Candidatus Aquilonibacter sp.]|nr:tetratricopeptide repeat protein [Candidatus Aquilonibacter sp.]
MSRPRFIALLLALLTLLAYLPVTRDQFLDYDDQNYVTENTNVLNGLTWSGVEWAFTTGHASNWHPLTWLSLMLDAELFGPNAGAFHFVNALFHAANAALLFVLLLRMTGALWPSAFVAALFAWHPLHVESVAWVSERKDVLSTFFALLALLCYERFVGESKVQSPKSKIFYALALTAFALALMAKPMFVTLPFVMLLLDFWPLQRFNASTLPRLLAEKIPFFALTAASCVVTFLAQSQTGGDAVASLQFIPLDYRLCNTLISYARYLLKLFCPTKLAVFYPLLQHITWMLVMAYVSAIALAAISWLAWQVRRQFPYVPVGWLWFLGTLVPVIGLVQVGGAALADRYTYFPAVGIFIIVAFGIRDLAERFQFPKIILPTAAALILVACLVLTENQLRYWRDSETLFTHALAVTKDNDVAHVNLGVALEEKGELNQALVQYRDAEELAPELSEVHNNLGNLLDKLEQPKAALIEYREAVILNPRSPALHSGEGDILAELGRYKEAMSQFKEAARLDPTYSWAYFQMGKVLLEQGRDAEAVDQFREALRFDPDNYQILAYVARVLAASENPAIRDGKAALTLATKANALTGGSQPVVLDALGIACAATGDFTNAVEDTQHALDLCNAAKMTGLEPLQQRLELYKKHQPWRESFLATNAPAKN